MVVHGCYRHGNKCREKNNKKCIISKNIFKSRVKYIKITCFLTLSSFGCHHSGILAVFYFGNGH